MNSAKVSSRTKKERRLPPVYAGARKGRSERTSKSRCTAGQMSPGERDDSTRKKLGELSDYRSGARRPASWRTCSDRDSWLRQDIQQTHCQVAEWDSCPAEGDTRASGLVYSRKATMPQSNRDPTTAETGERVPARPLDSGSQSHETADGLDSTTEALRQAAEDTASGAAPDDIEKYASVRSSRSSAENISALASSGPPNSQTS